MGSDGRRLRVSAILCGLALVSTAVAGCSLTRVKARDVCMKSIALGNVEPIYNPQPWIDLLNSGTTEDAELNDRRDAAVAELKKAIESPTSIQQLVRTEDAVTAWIARCNAILEAGQ